MFETFDSFAPPQLQKKLALADWSNVDLEEVKSKLAKVIEEAKANDPTELKRKIRDLEQKLRQVEQQQPATTIKEVSIFTDEDRRAMEKARSAASDLVGKIESETSQLWSSIGSVREFIAALDKRLDKLSVVQPPQRQVQQTRVVRPPPQIRHAENGHSTPAGVLGKGERIILTAIAQHAEGCTREQITVLTGYKRSSRDTYMQRLSSGNYIAFSGDSAFATAEGIAALGSFSPLPTGDALRAYWSQRLTGGEKAIFDLLCEQYPNVVEREAVTDATNYQRSSRDTYLQRLSSRKLVVACGRGAVKASDKLFA